MQEAPTYYDVVIEVRDFLSRKIEICRAAGLPVDRISIDPGFGFGKTHEHNLELLRHLGELGAGGLPITVGLSRKSLVGKLTGRPTGDRVYGSVSLAVIAAMKGARVVRVHDVAATVDALKVVAAVSGG
jgi:dihydropteroate synthase